MPPNKEAPVHSSSEEDALHAPKLRLITEGILIDFLGGLVPGMLFISAALVALAVPLQALFSTLAGQPHRTWSEIIVACATNIKQTPSAFWIAAFVAFALISFVTGHLFYRNDPKVPDQLSFKKISRGKTVAECEREFGCGNEEDCAFPYTKYHEYLKARGLDHLLPLVAWCHECGGTGKRSKTFINILKIRLRHNFPDKCSMIIWNEAHIRLATSSWYVANVLVWASIIGIIVSTVSFWLLIKTNANCSDLKCLMQIVGENAPNFVAPISVLTLSLFSKIQIERFLHYQRLREVFFVLETAFTAFRDHYELLAPPLDQTAVVKLNASKIKPTQESTPNIGAGVVT